MNLTLTRTEKRDDGIFGILSDEAGLQVAVTLEHAYDAKLGNGSYAPKLPAGTYKCVRGPHRLHGMTADFETFEITKVPGHTGMLFHWGNYNRDSNGCVLLGRRRAPVGVNNTTDMITSSRNTFQKFMDLQRNVNEFTLTVKD